MSRWNAYLDRLLAADLNETEHQLALGLMRHTLGWNKTSAGVGEALLRRTTGLHGRSLDRARSGLIDKGLIAFTPGSAGRGHRATYTLALALKTSALARAIEDKETPAPARTFAESVKPRAGGTKNPALQRGRIDRKGKPSERSSGDLIRNAFNAYLSAGGTLNLDRERGALARSVQSLASNVPHETILAGCRALGRENAFPGHLKATIEAINAAGGPCTNAGLNRSALDYHVLKACPCAPCTEWAATKAPSGADGVDTQPRASDLLDLAARLREKLETPS